MAAWNLRGAIEAASSNSKPEEFIYKIAQRNEHRAVSLSAKSLESAKMVCGRNQVVLLNGQVVFDRRDEEIYARMFKQSRADVARVSRYIKAKRG